MVVVDPIARTVAAVIAIGSLLLGGVVTTKLVGSTYRSDIEAICNAERGSGHSLQTSMTEVTRWLRAHLSTREGNELQSYLGYMALADRAPRLRREATSLRIESCPTVDSLERLVRESEYRKDLQRLCSGVSFPGLVDLDDGGREARLDEWIRTQGRSARTAQLGEALRAASPAERARLLRVTASDAAIFSCEVARLLLAPPPDTPPVASEPTASPGPSR
jgi:hypothetical protein